MEGEGYKPQPENPEAGKNKAVLERELSEFNLSERAYNVLTRNKFKTIGHLTQCGAEDLLNLRNFGPNQVIEVRELLAELGLHLKYEE